MSAPVFYFTDNIKNISILRVAIGAKDTHTAQTTISGAFVSEQVPCFVALFFCASVGVALREFFRLVMRFYAPIAVWKPKGAEIMTLKELQKRIERTGGKDLPTAAWLRAGNSPLAVSREIAKSGKLSVFVNGFALYETEDGSTVFRVDYCGGYTYFGANTEDTLSEEFFAETDWWVRLVVEGEDRLTHNRNARTEKNTSLYECDELVLAAACEFDEEIMLQELVEEVLLLMTPRQREVVKLYYLDELGVEEIASQYGISHQAVSETLSAAKKKVQKNRKKFW